MFCFFRAARRACPAVVTAATFRSKIHHDYAANSPHSTSASAKHRRARRHRPRLRLFEYHHSRSRRRAHPAKYPDRRNFFRHRLPAKASSVFFLSPPGHYELRVSAHDYGPFVISDLAFQPNEVVTLEISLVTSAAIEARSRLPRQPELGPALSAAGEASFGAYREFRHRLDSDPAYVLNPAAEVLPPIADVYNKIPDRWQLQQPEYRRYDAKGEYLYAKPRWYDPFNRNKFKGDEPIWPNFLGQQTFLNLTATSETFFDGRRVPSPSNVSTAEPGSSEFFGRGEQAFLDQTFRVSFDLFHGDASFKPVDWRIRITPEFSLNNLNVRELGIVGPSPLARHKSIRHARRPAGSFCRIQNPRPQSPITISFPFEPASSSSIPISAPFSFRTNSPACASSATFTTTKSNTTPPISTCSKKIPTAASTHLNAAASKSPSRTPICRISSSLDTPPNFSSPRTKTTAALHYDDNGFLVRPSPVGNVINQNPGVGPILHGIRVGYFGWLGSGHIKRVNLTHAFFQAVGEDTFNPIAGRRVTVNAQMAAAEVSYDHNWIRYRVSGFYASGDSNPRDGRARGFDSILDEPAFAGGLFSFWNREQIRLTGSGVSLTPPGSLLPSLRSNKEEGQANFVNPGIFLVNAGADFDVTPKLRAFANVNYLRFDRTEPLEFILEQAPIRHGIGTDYGIGLNYRPPLSENIVITGGASALTPDNGFRDIYGGHTLFSLFTSVRFTF